MERLDAIVIGGGISGLAAAWRFLELAPQAQIQVLDQRDRPGGVLHTVRQDGFLIERSADSFITDQPWAIDFCRRLGFDEQLIGTQPTNRRAYVVHRGRLEMVPKAFQILAPGNYWSVLKSPILSWRGKLRLFGERFVPPREVADVDDESLAQFAIRRLGHEAYERLVQPLVGGIYTADPTKLSISATLPRFVQMEAEYGSLTKAAHRARGKRSVELEDGTGARYGLFVTPRGGIGSMVDALVAKLPPDVVRCDASVENIERTSDGGWRVGLAGGEELTSERIVVATPAHVSRRLLAAVDSDLESALGGIPYAGCVIVCLGFRQEQIKQPPPGFGFVVPAVEKRRILAASFSSSKFPGRAPEGSLLIRAFVGGALQPELLDLDDQQVRQLVLEELDQLIGISGEPSVCEIARWDQAMPQYHVGHTKRVAQIQGRCEALGSIAIVGNAYRGVGIPHCIHTAEEAIDRLMAHVDA